MKKLLVLLLVLGLASAAHAVFSLSVNGEDAGEEITISPSDTFVLDITSDNSLPYTANLMVPDGPGTLSNLRTVQGNISGIIDYTYYPYFYWMITIADSGGALVPGTGFEADFHCDGPDDVILTLIDYDSGLVVDTLVVHQPEPMTIALLGLGGLFLRRRK